MKINCTLFLLLFLNTLFAGELTTIKGTAPAYANYVIEFYKLADPISKEKEILFQIHCMQDGTFSSKVELQATTHVFADFDTYQTSIYLVPGKNYELILPPQKKLTNSEKHNPFFKPIKLHLAVKDADDQELNRKIRKFERSYQTTEMKFFNLIYKKKSKAAVDTIQKIMNDQFRKGNDPFFEKYRLYRLAFTEFALHQGNNEEFIQRYFNAHPANFNIETFANLFDRQFANYFSQLANKIDGNAFRKIVGSSNPSAIEDYLKSKQKLSTEIARLVILKSVNDAFHQGQFSQKNLLKILKNIHQSNWTSSQKQIAQRLQEKLTFMLANTPAPTLTMTDFQGKIINLNDLKGKLTCIHFTRVGNPICRQHLDALKKLPEPVKKEVQFINLILDEEGSQQAQIEKQNWQGSFFIISDESAKRWKVKNYPNSFILDEDLNFIHSPAFNPLDGFNRQIGVLLQKRHLEKMRNQSK